MQPTSTAVSTVSTGYHRLKYKNQENKKIEIDWIVDILSLVLLILLCNSPPYARGMGVGVGSTKHHTSSALCVLLYLL